jgi:hypothetical protein
MAYKLRSFLKFREKVLVMRTKIVMEFLAWLKPNYSPQVSIVNTSSSLKVAVYPHRRRDC